MSHKILLYNKIFSRYLIKFIKQDHFECLRIFVVYYVVLSRHTYKTFKKMIIVDTLNSLTYTHLSPATPCTIRSSLVSVPVLSKQHTSTLPANGILKGSVQYTPRENNNEMKL